jgi:hypothetical protein
MHLSINTAEEISDLDRTILAALAGTGATAPAAVAQSSAPKASAATPAAAPAQPSGPGLQDAIDAATAVVGAGNPQLVKAALTQASPDSAKVSSMPVEHVQAFLDALEEQVAAAENPL